MTAPDRYRAVWDEDDMVPLPGSVWIERGLPAEALPEGGAIPSAVEAVYTTGIESDIELYEPIRLTAEDADLDIDFVVVGALPGEANLLYVMEPQSGGVFQLDLERHDVRGVNSTFRRFVECLYRFARFVEADDGAAGRGERAAELRRDIEAIDPWAFGSDAWWPLVFEQFTI